MVFVPLPPAAAVSLRGGSHPAAVRGFSATPSLRAVLGPDAGDDEVDYAALDAAGVAALHGLAGPRRLVLAVEARPDQVSDRRTDLGEVGVEGLRWDQVQALFADEQDAATAVTTAAEAAADVPLAQVLELPAVAELAQGYDLLWYAVDELDDLS
jgi:hypothetical protein